MPVDKRIGRWRDRPHDPNHVKGAIEDFLVAPRDVSWYRTARRGTDKRPSGRKLHASIGNRAACDGSPLCEFAAEPHGDVYARDKDRLCGRSGCDAIFYRVGKPGSRGYQMSLIDAVRDYQLDYLEAK